MQKKKKKRLHKISFELEINNNKCAFMGLSFGMLSKSHCTNDICVASHMSVSKIQKYDLQGKSVKVNSDDQRRQIMKQHQLFVCSLTKTLCAQLFAATQIVAHQMPVPTEFSRQRILKWVPIAILDHLPDPGVQPASLVTPAVAGRFFIIVTTRNPTH